MRECCSAKSRPASSAFLFNDESERRAKCAREPLAQDAAARAVTKGAAPVAECNAVVALHAVAVAQAARCKSGAAQYSSGVSDSLDAPEPAVDAYQQLHRLKNH
jgi:hypothetical protein